MAAWSMQLSAENRDRGVICMSWMLGVGMELSESESKEEREIYSLTRVRIEGNSMATLDMLAAPDS